MFNFKSSCLITFIITNVVTPVEIHIFLYQEKRELSRSVEEISRSMKEKTRSMKVKTRTVKEKTRSVNMKTYSRRLQIRIKRMTERLRVLRKDTRLRIKVKVNPATRCQTTSSFLPRDLGMNTGTMIIGNVLQTAKNKLIL